MSQSALISSPATAAMAGSVAAPAKSNVAWRNWLCVLAVAGLPVGLLWDISWHISIGRDTFWTPAHIVIQLGGIIPATLLGMLALKTTFWGTREERAGSIRFWGAYAPLGAWVTIWGSLAMVTSAPFDDWWHDAYGLDVKIISPPHALLGLGMFAVELGVLLSVLSWQNRATPGEQKTASWLFTLSCGLIVTMLSVYNTEFTWPNDQHTATYYRVICRFYPFLLAMTVRASKLRWSATIAAATYMGIMMLFIWILPLFHAQPKLAPIYNPVDHMVPPAFPTLLIIPALAIDLISQAFGRFAPASAATGGTQPRWWQRRWVRDWFLAFALGLAFVTLAFACQWNFSRFLISPAADNWFFAGSRIWPYYVQPGQWWHNFDNVGHDPVNFRALCIAAFSAVLATRLGLGWGNWMVKVRR